MPSAGLLSLPLTSIYFLLRADRIVSLTTTSITMAVGAFPRRNATVNTIVILVIILGIPSGFVRLPVVRWIWGYFYERPGYLARHTAAEE